MLGCNLNILIIAKSTCLFYLSVASSNLAFACEVVQVVRTIEPGGDSPALKECPIERQQCLQHEVMTFFKKVSEAFRTGSVFRQSLDWQKTTKCNPVGNSIFLGYSCSRNLACLLFLKLAMPHFESRENLKGPFFSR